MKTWFNKAMMYGKGKMALILIGPSVDKWKLRPVRRINTTENEWAKKKNGKEKTRY